MVTYGAASTLTNYYPHSPKRENGLQKLMLSLCHETSTLYYLSNPKDPQTESLEERAQDLIEQFSYLSECLCEEGESDALYVRLGEVKEDIMSRMYTFEENSFELCEEQVALYEELSPSKSSLMIQQTQYRQQQMKNEIEQRKGNLEQLYQILDSKGIS